MITNLPPDINTKQTIHVNGTQVQVDSTHDTLLEMLEEAGVEVQSHCRDGFCGFCRIKREQGDVDWVIEPLAYINNDELLACACKPVGNIALSTKYEV